MDLRDTIRMLRQSVRGTSGLEAGCLVMFLQVGMLGVGAEKYSFREGTTEHIDGNYIFSPSEEAKILITCLML